MESQAEVEPPAWPDRLKGAEAGATLALTAVALGLFVLHATFIPRAPVDDAGISVAYARTLAEGGGLRITAESAVAEGYSNPSWTFLLALLEALDVDTVQWLRPLGMLFSALALPLLMAWGPVAERRRLQLEDALPPLIAAAHPPYVHWAQGGLEMGIQLFGIALLGLLALATQTSRRAYWFGAAGALVVLTRPEGPLYAAAAGLGWPLMMLVTRRAPSRLELRWLLTALLPVAGYFVFRRLYFGEWVPNTYFAKDGWVFDWVAYSRSYVQHNLTLCFAMVWAGPFFLLGSARVVVRGLVTFAVLGALVYFCYHATGDWMLEWRFLAPLSPFQGAAIAVGISGLRAGLRRAGGFFERLAPHAAKLASLAAIALTSYALYKVIPSELARSEEVRRLGYDIAITLERGAPFKSVVDYVEPLGMTHPLVMASDLGVVSLGVRSAEVWDFAGLTDPAVSRHYRNLPAIEDILVHEGPPTIVISWGPGLYFRQLAIAQRYEEVYGTVFRLRGLTPEQDPRCPDGKSAVLALSRKGLKRAILAEARAGDPVRALARWRCAFSYLPDRKLPSEPSRRAIAIVAEQLGAEARAKNQVELALRHYALCALVGSHEVRLSVRCRKQAEALRAQLFPAPPPLPRPSLFGPPG